MWIRWSIPCGWRSCARPFALLLGYPAALFMADRHMKLGSTLVVLFIIPMWMNFLLRTIAWMSLLEDQRPDQSAFLAWIGVGQACS